MAYPIIWQPTGDDQYAKNPLFKTHPRSIIANGQFNKVPIMIGAAKDEGLLYSTPCVHNPEKCKELYIKDYQNCASKTFLGQYSDGALSKSLLQKTKEIAEFYFKNEVDFESPVGFGNFSDAFGDSGFLYGTHDMAE